MTAEEFRSSQLSYLGKNIDRVRRLLYPGLSEALRGRLGGDGGGGGSTPRRQEGYIRRYLLAVNVMAASVLRGLVETALSDLLAFFQINVAGNGNIADCCQGDKDDKRERPSGSSNSGGRPTVGSAAAGTEVGQARALHPGDNGACAGPPVFKIYLEESSSESSSKPSKLTCRRSLADLNVTVMDVVREVVFCFSNVPRVTYD
ncbi:unnamed protein product, partial [Laminaria digitata]